jgi:hypothetical protein
MNNRSKIFLLFNLAGFLLIATSCTNVQNKNTGQVEIRVDTADNIASDNVSVIYLLPSPGEILLRFYTADLKYKQEILNPAGNKGKYIGSKAQTLNLGVYIADMAYCAMFERSTETVNYLEAIQTLSTEAEISSNIFESLLVRSKANAGQIDSLMNISNEAFTNMLEFLETGGKEIALTQVSAGAYIESLFIALQSVDKFSEDNETLKLLAEMKYPMENLMEKAKSATANETDKAIINYLNQIAIIFNELENNGSKTVITKNASGEISIQGGEEMVINEANFNDLKKKVAEIRNNIVSF